MTVKEYISRVEDLAWLNTIELFGLMKKIPPFEIETGIAFEIIKFKDKKRLKAVGVVASNLREFRTIVGNKFGKIFRLLL